VSDGEIDAALAILTDVMGGGGTHTAAAPATAAAPTGPEH
jgi:hypothetical protein